MQKSTDCFIPYTSFSRVVHEILADQGDFCIRSDAVHALQTAAEDRLTGMFQQANRLAQYGGRETVLREDIKFVFPPDECLPLVASCEDSAFPLPEQDQ